MNEAIKLFGDWDVSICFDLISQYEGFSPTAYKDSVGIWTIGYGTTEGVKQGDTITKEEAKQRMLVDLKRMRNYVAVKTRIEVTANQFIALMSLIYNIGVANFLKSTLRKCLLDGRYDLASEHFTDWKYAGGKPILLGRRLKEQKVFNG